MFEIEKPFEAPEITPYPSLGDPGKAVFFDIETTGLSPYGSALYLIGAAFLRGGVWHLHQWFSVSLSDEIPVLTAFSEFLSGFETVVLYNGDTFDIPYLKALYAQYHLPSPFERLRSIDLLKSARRVRPLVNPESLRQKDIERALGIFREDRYSGAELIGVYRNWQECPDDRLLHALLLHNEEDVKGMLPILSILSYDEILCGNVKPVSLENAPFKENYIRLEAVYPFRFPLIRSMEGETGLRAAFQDDRVTLLVPVRHAVLRRYLPNPKQYYYLPAEDMVVPKEMGSGVDPKNRIQARKETCYVRCEDDFVKAFPSLAQPAFRKDLSEKTSWVRLKDVIWDEYLDAFLQDILTFRPGHAID